MNKYFYGVIIAIIILSLYTINNNVTQNQSQLVSNTRKINQDKPITTTNYITHTKIESDEFDISPLNQQTLHYNTIFPFTTSNSPITAQISYSPYRPNLNNHQKKIAIYEFLDNWLESNINQFICPSETPFAIEYQLKYDINNMQVTGRAYRNACAFSGGSRSFNDLLYGIGQQVVNFGTADNLNAFIPYETPEGCKDDNFSITLKIESKQLEITPIYQSEKIEQVIGYRQEFKPDLPHDCHKYCTSMLNKFCTALTDGEYYCKETISDSYYIHSIYHARHITEDFCSCAVHSAATNEFESFTFTNAVDIHNVITFKNPIISVTCSN
jgi:hypothetical protein